MSPTQRLVMLQNVHDVKAVQQLENADVQLLRPVHQLSELFKQHREQAQWLLLSALLILAIGQGPLWQKSILPLVLPVSMALMTTFAIQAWLGVEINLFSIMGTFLIIGIGVDYAIFYRHGHDHPQVVGMALFLCMMSTFFGFGLLSLVIPMPFTVWFNSVAGRYFSFIYATLLHPRFKTCGGSTISAKELSQGYSAMSTMQQTDVLIIGAGPSGSSAAACGGRQKVTKSRSLKAIFSAFFHR